MDSLTVVFPSLLLGEMGSSWDRPMSTNEHSGRLLLTFAYLVPLLEWGLSQKPVTVGKLFLICP